MKDEELIVDDRLEQFEEMNSRDKKATWRERSETIHQTFPSVAALDWEKSFRVDPALMGRLIGDILKIEAAEPGKPGKRPTPSPDGGEERFRRLAGEDFSHLPFPQAFKSLTYGRSVRSLAASTNISKSKIHNLMSGLSEPTVHDMEEIASACRKRPDYFWEYRKAYIAGMVIKHLNYSSEASVIIMQKVKQLAKANKEKGLL